MKKNKAVELGYDPSFTWSLNWTLPIVSNNEHGKNISIWYNASNAKIKTGTWKAFRLV
jgi:hypothetical protein